MAEALIALRFVHFAAAMAAWGIAAFRLYAFAGAALPATATARAALDAVLVRGMAFAAAAALLAALAIVPLTAAGMTGNPGAALDLATAHAVLADTAFGHVWCWHLGFAAALLALCATPRGSWQPGATALAALAMLASLGWVGHAAMDMGGGIAQQINQMVHLSAAGLWLGGLVPLALLLRHATRPEDPGWVPLASAALPHFSQIGYGAVALVALTGTVNTAMLAGSFHALAATPYGRLLAVKIALFLAMVGAALVNRFRLLPRLRKPAATGKTLRALYLSVLAEQLLGLTILAVVSVLGTWPPAVEGMAM
jgi:copper resistance protein D